MKYNIKYTSEYILNLQIHQHSLLTRKVFSWHNSSTQVFITGSSSKLDHHQSWIIIIIVSSISLKWCYLSILLVIGSSTDPAFFHVGCMPSLHVGLHRESQPFFMLDVTLETQPFFMLVVVLHLQSQTFSMLVVALQSQSFFMLVVRLALYKFFLYRPNPFSCWL